MAVYLAGQNIRSIGLGRSKNTVKVTYHFPYNWIYSLMRNIGSRKGQKTRKGPASIGTIASSIFAAADIGHLCFLSNGSSVSVRNSEEQTDLYC
jgi:hypothetical protein